MTRNSLLREDDPMAVLFFFAASGVKQVSTFTYF